LITDTRGRGKDLWKRTGSADVIHTRDEEAVRVITIDRPEARNALRPTDLTALRAAVDETKQPVAYLRGAGEAFCAGADLDVVVGLDDPEAFARQGQQLTAAIADADAVVVCGTDGAARGGGVELALAADVRVATPAATFAEPGVAFGLFGAWGGTVRLPRVMGEGEALDFALSGARSRTPTRRVRTGLVSRVVDGPRAVADEIAAGKPDALRVIKRRIRDRREEETQAHAEAAAFGELVRSHADEIAASRDR